MAFLASQVTREFLQGLKVVTVSTYPTAGEVVGEKDPSSLPKEEYSFELALFERVATTPRWLEKLLGSHEQKYHVILTQSTSVPEEGREPSMFELERVSFELFRGTEQSESTKAFHSIQNGLSPVIESGCVTFDAELLSSLLLPSPRPLKDLPSILLQSKRVQGNGYVGAKFDGRTLLHLACEADDESSFKALLEDKGADFRAKDDHTLSSVLHWAARHSLACLKHLLEHAKSLSKDLYFEFLHHRDSNKHSPLHTAFLHRNAEAVEVLAAAGVQLTVPTADIEEENPLHVAAREDCHECISSFFKRHGFLQPIREEEKKKKADQERALRSTNADGDTPLLVAVRKKHLKSALTLILEEADPNAPNTATLDTPLHVAAQEGDATIVQILLVFGANPNARNKQGKTPVELAQETHEHHAGREKSIEAIQAVTAAQTKEVAPLPTLDPLPEGSAVLLSLDGGGIRGLVLAQLLLTLQDRVSKLCPNCPHLSNLFDWVAGTSTGAFLGLAFVHFGASPTQCRKLYFHFKNKALVGSRVYPTNLMESSLREEFGDTDKMADISGPRMIMTTCLADRLPPILHLMCNYGGARDDQEAPSNLLIWEAARATSAAPTYFTAFKKKFLDGGVMANNPTLDAMAEIFSQGQKNGQERIKLGCVISLGTGIPPTTNLSEGVSVVNPHNPLDLLNDFEALKDLAELFMAQSTASYGQDVTRGCAWCESMGTPFFRFSPPIDNIMLDETNDVKLIKMLYDTMLYTLENRAKYDQLAQLLLTKTTDQ